MTVLRSTQNEAEVLAGYDPTLRSTQNEAEVLAGYDPKLRSTQNLAEVLVGYDVTLRSSQVFAEVLHKVKLNIFLPDEDISVGNWTPTPIFDIIDEDDASCVESELTPSNDIFEVGLADIPDFDSNQDLQLRVKFGKVDSVGDYSSDGDIIDLTIDVREGNSTISTFLFEDVSGEEAATTLVVPAVGKAVIQDANKLSVRVNANTSSVVSPRACNFCFLNAETSEPTVLLEPPIVTFDGSGVSYNGNAVINYSGPQGTEDVGWKSHPPYINIDGSVPDYGNTLANRFKNTRYYRGDSS